MRSLRVRAYRRLVETVIRRRDWGSPEAATRRARRLFHVPRPYRWLRSRGLDIEPARIGGLEAEWVRPRKPTRRTILYLHGGGYIACSPGDMRPTTAGLSRRTPARVLAPDYRLAPEFPYPAAVDDAEQAYRWLLADGVRPDDLAVAGDSAGGGLALALLFRLREGGVVLPACAVVFSPWTDLAGTGASLRANDGKCSMFRPENIPAIARCYAPPERWREPEISPLYGRFDDLPPLQIQVGDDEVLYDDAARVHERARAAGVSSELVVWTRVAHGWQNLDGIAPEARRALEQAADFVAARTRGRRSPMADGQRSQHDR